MAYTYTLNATDVKCGRRSSYSSTYTGYSAYTDGLWVGGNTGKASFATYALFDANALSTYSKKTITSIQLRFTVASGTIPSNGTNNYPICAKANAGSSTEPWQRIATPVLQYIRNQTSGGSQITASNTQITATFLENTLPSYGVIFGPANANLTAHVVLAWSSSYPVQLLITTNETAYNYTLAYNANNGSGAPGNQTGSNIGTTASYTFTISSTSPTRSGYTFLGWSTSSTATSASYQPGGTITVSNGTTTLYAVWKRANTVRVVNGSALDTYLVYIVENSALAPYRVTVVNSAGTGLDIYT